MAEFWEPIADEDDRVAIDILKSSESDAETIRQAVIEGMHIGLEKFEKLPNCTELTALFTSIKQMALERVQAFIDKSMLLIEKIDVTPFETTGAKEWAATVNQNVAALGNATSAVIGAMTKDAHNTIVRLQEQVVFLQRQLNERGIGRSAQT